MAKLTTAGRKRLKGSSFAVDGQKRKYPIHDIAHARNALARVSAHGTPAEKAQVRRKVSARYPSLRK